MRWSMRSQKLSSIGFSHPHEEEGEVQVQYGELEIDEEEEGDLVPAWLEVYAIQLPAFLWAIILILTVGFASGILRVEFGRG